MREAPRVPAAVGAASGPFPRRPRRDPAPALQRWRPQRCGWGIAAGLSLLGLLPGGPVAASPRVTLTLEGATLHQILRRLHGVTALQFTTSEGAGNEGHQEPAGARRINVAWNDEPLGRVLRQLCHQFGLRAASNGDSGYWFQPGAPPKRTETQSNGIAFAVGAMHQQENVNALPGDPAPLVQRSLQIALVCRALDGEGDAIAGLGQVRILDAQGRSREPRLTVSPYDWSPLPDERTRSIMLDWDGEQPTHLARLEGTLSVYSRVEEQRWTVPLPAAELPMERELGPVRASLATLKREGRSLEVRARLQWAEGSDVAFQGAGAVRAFAKLDSGKYQRLYGSIQPGSENQGRSISLELQGQCESPPVALELRVPVRSGPLRAVPFRFDNLLLPFGRPLSLRTTPLNQRAPSTVAGGTGFLSPPPGLADSDGGMLTVKVPAALAEGDELALGLSRRSPDGTWSPFRWLYTTHPGADVRIERLKVGKYRVRLRGSPRPAAGEPAAPAVEANYELQAAPVGGAGRPPKKE